MNSHSSLLRIFSRETKHYRQNVTFWKYTVFLKTDFFAYEDRLGSIVLYMYLPGVQYGGQETFLGYGMTQVFMHVIPKPECLRVYI